MKEMVCAQEEEVAVAHRRSRGPFCSLSQGLSGAESNWSVVEYLFVDKSPYLFISLLLMLLL